MGFGTCFHSYDSRYLPTFRNNPIFKEVLGCEGKVHRGRVLFDVEPSNIKQCLKLRTVNNLYVLVGHTHKV